MGLEESGDVKSPIVRDPTGESEFIDADGQQWNVKGFNSNFPPRKGGFDLETDANKVDFELNNGENVMLDKKNMSQADIDALRAEGESRGWGDRVKWSVN